MIRNTPEVPHWICVRSDDVETGPRWSGPNLAGTIVASGNDVVLADVHRLHVRCKWQPFCIFTDRKRQTSVTLLQSKIMMLNGKANSKVALILDKIDYFDWQTQNYISTWLLIVDGYLLYFKLHFKGTFVNKTCHENFKAKITTLIFLRVKP